MRKSICVFLILFLIVIVPATNGYQSISNIYSSIFSKFFSFITGRVVGDSGSSSSASGNPNCDADNDGYSAQSCGGNDCNDDNFAVHPGATENCNNQIDDDCNGEINEGCATISNNCNTVCYIPPLDPISTNGHCEPITICGLTCPTLSSEDGANFCLDEIDNDCDNNIDCDDSSCSDECGGYQCTDNDNDGFYSESGCGTSVDCNDNTNNDPLQCSNTNVDCSLAQYKVCAKCINPNAEELECNGIDEDCSGSDICTNPPQPGQLCTDLDDDNVSTCNGDCNDNDPNVKPGLNEICNDAKDNDCDGTINEGCTNICVNAPDLDLDGANACLDCDDDNSQRRPNRQEVCGNAIDDNCNQIVDEGCAATCGDGICNGETCSNCPQDCGTCPTATGQVISTDLGLSEEVLLEVAQGLNDMRINLESIRKTLRYKAEQEGDITLEDASRIVENIEQRIENLNNRISERSISENELIININQIRGAMEVIRNIIH